MVIKLGYGGEMKNKYTLIIQLKGWKVADACARWGIRYETYNARCNNERMEKQLLDMCNGLPHKQGDDIDCGFTLGKNERNPTYMYMEIYDPSHLFNDKKDKK